MPRSLARGAWLTSGDLVCPRCKLIFECEGPQVIVAAKARELGWIVVRSPEFALCVECGNLERLKLVREIPAKELAA